MGGGWRNGITGLFNAKIQNIFKNARILYTFLSPSAICLLLSLIDDGEYTEATGDIK